jgi:iron complex transport system ATP-binding protein
MALEIQNLRFSWNEKELLKSVSFSLMPGEFAGFLGPNGSGKSTFLKNILGFLKPHNGKILYADAGCPAQSGFPAELTAKEKARRFSFVPQSAAFAAPFSVSELALMGRLPHLQDRWAGYTASDRHKALAAMETMGLTPLANRVMPSLSGGETQKAVIARCLAQEGDVILLDEATSGLDLNHAIEVMELMRKKTTEEKKIVLAVLHDLNLASQYCDRILLLKDGELRYQGKPEEVLTEAVIEDVYGIRAVVRIDERGRPFVLPRREESNV